MFTVYIWGGGEISTQGRNDVPVALFPNREITERLSFKGVGDLEVSAQLLKESGVKADRWSQVVYGSQLRWAARQPR